MCSCALAAHAASCPKRLKAIFVRVAICVCVKGVVMSSGKGNFCWLFSLRAKRALGAGVVVMLALAMVAVLAMGVGAMGLFAGTRPDHLGIRDGHLAAVKSSPNNVSSQADARTDPSHYVAPLAFGTTPDRALQALKRSIAAMARAEIVTEHDGYLHAEFTTRLMRFVDDVEFQIDPSGFIHVRSGSRLGQSDFGVNRARVEALRRLFFDELQR